VRVAAAEQHDDDDDEVEHWGLEEDAGHGVGTGICRDTE
jgi:hypothetical protein